MEEALSMSAAAGEMLERLNRRSERGAAAEREGVEQALADEFVGKGRNQAFDLRGANEVMLEHGADEGQVLGAGCVQLSNRPVGGINAPTGSAVGVFVADRGQTVLPSRWQKRGFGTHSVGIVTVGFAEVGVPAQTSFDVLAKVRLISGVDIEFHRLAQFARGVGMFAKHRLAADDDKLLLTRYPSRCPQDVFDFVAIHICLGSRGVCLQALTKRRVRFDACGWLRHHRSAIYQGRRVRLGYRSLLATLAKRLSIGQKTEVGQAWFRSIGRQVLKGPVPRAIFPRSLGPSQNSVDQSTGANS